MSGGVIILLLALAAIVECAVNVKLSALSSLDSIENVDVRLTFAAGDSFDTIDLLYAQDDVLCKPLPLRYLDYSSRIFTSSGQTIAPLSIRTATLSAQTAFVSVTFPQVAGVSGSAAIVGVRGAASVPVAHTYEAYTQQSATSLTYAAGAHPLAASCFSVELRLSGVLAAAAPTLAFYPFARRGMWAHHTPGNTWINLRAPVSLPASPLLLPTAVTLRLSPALAAAAAGSSTTLRVDTPVGEDMPLAGTVTAVFAANGTVMLGLFPTTASAAPLLTGVLRLRWEVSELALTAMIRDSPLVTGADLMLTFTYPGAFTAPHTLLYPFSLSPLAIAPPPTQDAGAGSASDGATQLSLDVSQTPPFATRACSLRFDSNIMPTGPTGFELVLQGFPAFRRLGLDAAQATTLRICEARGPAAAPGSLKSFLSLISANAQAPDLCSFTTGAATHSASLVRVAPASSGAPVCARLALPATWLAALRSASQTTASPNLGFPVNEFWAIMRFKCSFTPPTAGAGDDTALVVPPAGGAVSLELLQSGPPERLIALQQTCALEPLPPASFTGARALVMFTAPRNRSHLRGLKFAVTATTTRIRAGSRRLAVRVVERGLDSPDLNPARHGLRELLKLFVGKNCIFIQRADRKAVLVDSPTPAEDQTSTGTFSLENGVVLTDVTEIEENVPWTLTCDTAVSISTDNTNVHFPYGIADGVAVEIASCTNANPPVCDAVPLAMSRPRSDTGRDTDLFVDAEWEANPVRMSLLAGTGPAPLSAAIVPSAHDAARGSINVPFTLVAERHLEEHPVSSIGLSVDLLNVFLLGTTPRCVLMDPLGTLAEAYIPHGTYAIAYTSDVAPYPGSMFENDARTRLSITGFPPARVNALIVLSCTGQLHVPSDANAARSAIVTATVDISGVAPVVLSLSHLGLKTRATFSPPEEFTRIGYSRYGITFGRAEIDAPMSSGSVQTVDSKLAAAGLNVVMVLLSPRSPKFMFDGTYDFKSDANRLYWILGDETAFSPSMCRVHTPAMVSWTNGASSSHIARDVTQVENPGAPGRKLTLANAETPGSLFEGGAIILRCSDTTRQLVYTSWTGNPWRRTRTAFAVHARSNSRMYGITYGQSHNRFAANYIFEAPYVAQDVQFEPFPIEPFSFHVPVATLAYETAVVYAATHPWPPPGRYVTRYPQLSVQVMRRVLDTGTAPLPAAARRLPGGRTPVARRVTVVVQNSVLFNFRKRTADANNNDGMSSTFAMMTLMLEQRYPAAGPGTALTDVIDASSITIDCVSPNATALAFSASHGFDIVESSIADTASREGISSSSLSSVTVRGSVDSNADFFGWCISAHFSFTVYSLATSQNDGAYDTQWRARVALHSHEPTEDMYSTRRQASYVYQFVEAVPSVAPTASAPVGAFYTSDSLRMGSAVSSVISDSADSMLTFDVIGLNTTDGLQVSLFLPPSIAIASPPCTATAFLADRASANASQVLSVSNTVTPGPLGSWLNITVNAFIPSPAPTAPALYRHSVRFECPYRLADPTHYRRSRLPVRAALFFTAPSWHSLRALTLTLPPLASRHVRVISKPVTASDIGWTDYRALTRSIFDMRVLSDDGTAQDADIAHALAHLKTVSGGFTFTADPDAPARAVFPRHSSVSASNRTLTGPVAVVATAVPGRQYYSNPTPVAEHLRASVRTPGTIRDFVGINAGAIAVVPRLVLSDADVPASALLTCGSHDCGAASNFRLEDPDSQSVSCFNIERVDPEISLLQTMWPLAESTSQAAADALATTVSNSLPAGTFLPMYCHDNTLLPARSMVCDQGMWLRSSPNGSPAVSVPQCSSTNVCDPFSVSNAAVLLPLNVHMPTGYPVLRVGDTLSAPCVSGSVTPAATGHVLLTCPASRVFALAPGESGCVRFCPELPAANEFTTYSYSGAPQTIPASSEPGAPLIRGYAGGSSLTVTCASGSYVSLRGEPSSGTSSVSCDASTGAWATAPGAVVQCLQRCDVLDSANAAALAALHVDSPANTSLAWTGDTRTTQCAIGHIARKGPVNVEISCHASREFGLAPEEPGCSKVCLPPDMSNDVDSSFVPESRPFRLSASTTGVGYAEGTLLTWKCPLGAYATINGSDLSSSTLACTATGAWTGSVSALHCREICSATEPAAVARLRALHIGAVFNTDGAAVGETRTASCVAGRTSRTGTVQLVCNPARTFVLAPEEGGCSLLCPALTATSGATAVTYSTPMRTIPSSDAPGSPLINGFYDGSTVTVQCGAAFHLSTSGGAGATGTATCDGTTGAWSAPLGCTLACPIQAPEHGAVEFPAAAGPAVATYTCEAGYEFVGASHARSISHECTQAPDPPGETRNGWSGVRPQCVLAPTCAVADVMGYPSGADSLPELNMSPVGFTFGDDNAYDDSFGRPCPEDAVCSQPAAGPDSLAEPAATSVPVGTVATPTCGPRAAPRGVTPWPSAAAFAQSSAAALQVLRCVRVRDAGTGLSSAVWSTAAAAYAAAADALGQYPSGLYAACIDSPLFTSAALTNASSLVLATFSMPTSKPTGAPGSASLPDPNVPSAATCAYLLAPASLVSLGGAGAACSWSASGTELVIALGPGAVFGSISPLRVSAGVIFPDLSAYAALFAAPDMSALSLEDLARASITPSGAMSAPVVTDVSSLTINVEASSTADAATPFRVRVTAATTSASRPLSVQYQLVVGEPGTVTTAADAAAFAAAVAAYIARWTPPGPADDLYDGRSASITVPKSVINALSPGPHVLRVEAQSWMVSFGVPPAVKTHPFTVIALPVVDGATVAPVRVEISAAGVTSSGLPSLSAAEFDGGQQLIVEVALQSSAASVATIQAQWTLTPDPGAAAAVGAGALTAARTLIFPPDFFAPRTRYTLSLHVVQRVPGLPDTEVTATVAIQRHDYNLVASVAVESLVASGGGLGVSTQLTTQRAAPTTMTAAAAQQLVADSVLRPLATVALDQMANTIPTPEGDVLRFDASGSYDPEQPRGSPARAARPAEWTCHRVLRTVSAAGGGPATYVTREVYPVFYGTGPRQELSREALTTLGPLVVDGTEQVTLIYTMTVRAVATADPRASQAVFSVCVVPTLALTPMPLYVPPLIGAVSSTVRASLASRLDLDLEARAWAAAPLNAPLRLHVAVVAPHRDWMLRWVCDDCGSVAADGSALPSALDLSDPLTAQVSPSTGALVVSPSALAPSARYKFRVGMFATPEGSLARSAALASLQAGGSDPLAGADAVASFSIYTPSAPRGGLCGFEPLDPLEENGKSLLVFCRGWQDDTDALPLKYRWAYTATLAASPVDVLFAVSDSVSLTAGELRLAFAPGAHSLSVEIINTVGGSVRVELDATVPEGPGGNALAAAQYHVDAARASLAQLDAVGFTAAIVSAACTARSSAGAAPTDAAAHIAGVLSAVSDLIKQSESLWLLMALENQERTVRATGDDTVAIAFRDVSAFTSIHLMAAVQSLMLANASVTTLSDGSTARIDVLAALAPAELSAVTALHASSAALARDVLANLVDQGVPVPAGTGHAVASLVSAYADIKALASPTDAASAGPSVADVIDQVLAPTAAALLLDSFVGDAPQTIASGGLTFTFGRVDGRVSGAADSAGWAVRGGSLVRAAFPYAGIADGVLPAEAGDEPAFWLPSEALSAVLKSAAASHAAFPSFGVDVAFVSGAGLAVALGGDPQHASVQPPSGAIWAEGDAAAKQPPGVTGAAAGLTLIRPGSARGAATLLSGIVPLHTNGSVPAPSDSAGDPKLVWVSVSHDPPPAPLSGDLPYVAECRFFDVAAQAWSGDGCAVAASSNTRTWCKCNHLTVFSVRWSPSYMLPIPDAASGSILDSLTAGNIAKYPAPVIALAVLACLGIVLFVVFFFVDVRYDTAGITQLLASWDLKTQRKTSLYDEFGLAPESSTASFLWHRYLYVLQRDHLWFSLFFRPRTDNYSSQARASAVVLMLLVTMVISGGIFRSYYVDSVALTAFVTAIVMYPIVIIWHALFDGCSRDRLKRFVYRYAEEIAYLQLTGTSDFFPHSEWKQLLARRSREIDEVAELVAEVGDWRVAPGDVEIVPMQPRAASHTGVCCAPIRVVATESNGVSLPPVVLDLPASSSAKHADPFSVAASAAIANAMQRGFNVRQRQDTAFTFSGFVASLSCAALCVRGGRRERQRAVHRVAPLIPLDHSHVSYLSTLSSAPSTASSGPPLSPRTPQQAMGSLARVQVVSLIAMASAGVSPDECPSPAAQSAAFGFGSDDAAQRRAIVESELAKFFILPDVTSTNASTTVKAAAPELSCSSGAVVQEHVSPSEQERKHLLARSATDAPASPLAPASSFSTVSNSSVTPRSASRVSLALADLSENLVLVRVPCDSETRRRRDHERLHFLLRYSVALDAEEVARTYRERAWELSQPRGHRFLAAAAVLLCVAVCFFGILAIGVELDLHTGRSDDARRVSERWLLSALLAVGVYIVVSSPLGTLIRSTATYAVKGWAKGRSRPSAASGWQQGLYASARLREDASPFDDGGDARFDGMPRPATSRRFSFVGPHTNFFSAPSDAVTRTRSSVSCRAVLSEASVGNDGHASIVAPALDVYAGAGRSKCRKLNHHPASNGAASFGEKARLYIESGLDFEGLDGC